MSRTIAKRDIKPVAPNPIARANIPMLPWDIFVRADWQNLPMLEAQAAYARLRQDFEKAGAILNARSTGANTEWRCYMSERSKDCPSKGQLHNTLPRFMDLSHKHPKTGLIEPVRCCSEICSIRYQSILIDERREREAPKRGE